MWTTSSIEDQKVLDDNGKCVALVFGETIDAFKANIAKVVAAPKLLEAARQALVVLAKYPDNEDVYMKLRSAINMGDGIESTANKGMICPKN